MSDELIRKSEALKLIDSLRQGIEELQPVNAVELPCKVGDTVYFILRSFDGKMRINPEKVCYFTIDANELRIHTTAGYFTERDMNDGVFFTRERAEQVLKERDTK